MNHRSFLFIRLNTNKPKYIGSIFHSTIFVAGALITLHQVRIVRVSINGIVGAHSHTLASD